MNAYSTVALLLATSVVVIAGPYYRTAPKIEISQPGESSNTNLGKVNGLRSCGGPGRAVEWRIDGCSGEGTCRLPGDGEPRQSELEFIPSEDIDGLGIRFIVITNGDAQTVYERPVADSAVQGAQTYIVHAAGGATKELQGQTITTQYILYRVDNNNVEVCAEADFQIV